MGCKDTQVPASEFPVMYMCMYIFVVVSYTSTTCIFLLLSLHWTSLIVHSFIQTSLLILECDLHSAPLLFCNFTSPLDQLQCSEVWRTNQRRIQMCGSSLRLSTCTFLPSLNTAGGKNFISASWSSAFPANAYISFTSTRSQICTNKASP